MVLCFSLDPLLPPLSNRLFCSADLLNRCFAREGNPLLVLCFSLDPLLPPLSNLLFLSLDLLFFSLPDFRRFSTVSIGFDRVRSGFDGFDRVRSGFDGF